ncbi:UTP:RNA uridylyltransferase 1 [Selaginella moellendorffii]|nr:UTP:RNA uridylyltransferase 1 [Selaginella moellendorffii]|eukprot:XP_002983593.2 UTP:RNA uridylyltransferase 1 [Selaginella moellendorffii]
MTWNPPQVRPPNLSALVATTQSEDELGLDVSSPSGDLLLHFLKSGGGDEQLRSSSSDSWQLQDPAVAAHGPSHSFAPPGGSGGGGGGEVPPPRPLYVPAIRFGGWSPHFQQHQDPLFPSDPFLTPSDHGFLRSFAPLPVERPFHPPVPYPFPNAPTFQAAENMVHPPHSSGELKVRPGPGLHFGSPVFGPSAAESSDSKRAVEQPRRSVTPVKDDKQQFYGNGSELLQLLQGGPGRVKPTSSTKLDATSDSGDSGEPSKKGSPSTLHGPIGPPRRQIISPPESPNDILGRMWAAPPSSRHALFDGEGELKPSASHRSLSAEVNETSGEVDGGGAAGFSLLKRRGSEPASSRQPLNGYDYVDSKANEKPRTNSASGRLQEYRGRYANGEAEFEPGSDDFRGAGRRRGTGRTDARRGGRGSAGQWIAVNERQRDAEPSDITSCDVSDARDESFKSSNGTHSKARRKHQQEWRIKQADSKAAFPAEKKPDYKFPKARSLASQLEHPGLPSGSTQNSSVGAAFEESKQRLHNLDALEEEDVTASLDLEELQIDGHRREGKAPQFFKPKENRFRESRRVIPMHRRDLLYRLDLQNFTRELLSLYDELIPTEEEEVRRRKFFSKLESLFERELPGTRLFLFGSCVNAFGVCNSDIDVCLSVDEEEPNKIELVVQMATILESDAMLNVQALTHARVPIVKFTEPATGISCDICVNNTLAVVNSKLLHDYAQIDVRLRQLAFMVKHWAKRRQVNDTYRGTLSSYAYVLMCIHFLQQRRPPILPCLQEMRPTYEVKVGSIRCAYYDQVETLRDFGADNKETLGELLTAFFDYWACQHDYNHSVISVRTGGYLSKNEKEWTRRIGNERHLICIEDPFEVTHDLGRVVDKHSIKALRAEFSRAANVVAFDFNPWATLFEPYIPSENTR